MASGPHTPRWPTELSRSEWANLLKRAAGQFRQHNLMDWAAALTYYGVLSIFPALLVIVSAAGLIGGSVTHPLIDNLESVAPGPAEEILTGAISGIEDSRSSASIVFVVGLAGALWAASGYIGAFTRASNLVYEIDERRTFWRLKPQQLALTALILMLVTASALAVVLTGPLASEAAALLGVGDTASSLWSILKWPLLVFVVWLIVALLYWAAPTVEHPGFRWITPGSALAVVAWLVTSALFSLYVSHFGSYNATYGALAGVIVFLIWLWISNLAVLLGAQLNAELEHGRELARGTSAPARAPLDG